VSLPTHLGPNGLPVGIQLIAARHRDDELLRTAAWVLQTLGAAPINKAADTLVA
jgi:amidase